MKGEKNKGREIDKYFEWYQQTWSLTHINTMYTAFEAYQVQFTVDCYVCLVLYPFVRRPERQEQLETEKGQTVCADI